MAELCVRLDGLPLALELAAARIKLLAPQDILERLGARLELLRAEPGTGVPERHRTLRAAIEWSYALLGAEEQALFTSLGVFVGGFTLDGARAIAGDRELDVVARIESLLQQQPAARPSRWPPASRASGCSRRSANIALDRMEERGDRPAVRAGTRASTYRSPRRPSRRCSGHSS